MVENLIKLFFAIAMSCGLVYVNSVAAAMGPDQMRAEYEVVVIPALQSKMRRAHEIIDVIRRHNPATARRYQAMLADIARRPEGDALHLVEQLTGQAEQLNAQLIGLQARYDRVVQENRRLHDFEVLNQRMARQRQELQEQLAHAQEQLRHMADEHRELDEVRAQHEAQQIVVDNQVHRLEEFNARLVAALQENHELAQRGQAREAAIAALTEQNRQLNAELDRYRIEQREVRKDFERQMAAMNDRLQSENKKHELELAAAQQELATLRRQAELANVQHDALVKENQAALAQAESLAGKRTQLEAEWLAKDQEIQALRVQVASLTVDRDKAVDSELQARKAVEYERRLHAQELDALKGLYAEQQEKKDGDHESVVADLKRDYDHMVADLQGQGDQLRRGVDGVTDIELKYKRQLLEIYNGLVRDVLNEGERAIALEDVETVNFNELIGQTQQILMGLRVENEQLRARGGQMMSISELRANYEIVRIHQQSQGRIVAQFDRLLRAIMQQHPGLLQPVPATAKKTTGLQNAYADFERLQVDEAERRKREEQEVRAQLHEAQRIRRAILTHQRLISQRRQAQTSRPASAASQDESAPRSASSVQAVQKK